MSQETTTKKSEFTIDLVLKVGGSCLTDKSGHEKLCKDGLDRLAELAAAIEAAEVEIDDNDGSKEGDVCGRRPLRWVLLHGGGSFGHPHAVAARLSASAGHQLAKLTPMELQRRRLGLCDTRRAVLDLSGRVAARLVTAGVPIATLSPCGHFSDAANLAESHWPAGLAGRVCDLLRAGFVPALHGDAVLARDRNTADASATVGWSVLGSDALAAQLAGSFHLRRAVFVTSSGGIFNEDPATAAPGTAHLLTEIRIGEGGSSDALSGVGGVVPGVSDVTGGMRGKLAAVERLLEASPGTEVRVCGWDSALAACLGTGGGGTRVLPS